MNIQPVRRALCVFTSLALVGCATQNHFAPAVIDYNNQTERAQDGAVLLNVLRASKRRPLTFFDVTTVTGASPASGSLGFSIPLSQNHTTSRAATTVAPMVSLSGGPAVTAGPVVTQEFYRGILTPISKATIDLFVQRGISRDLLFNLFFRKIEFEAEEGQGKDQRHYRISVENLPSDDIATAHFERVVEWLIDSGLTTKATDPDFTPYGPIYLPQELVGVDLTARAAAAGLQVDSVNWCELDIDDQLEVLARIRDMAIPPHSLPNASATPVQTLIEQAARHCHELAVQEAKLAAQTKTSATRSAGSAPHADEYTLEPVAKLKLGWSSAMLDSSVPTYLYRLEKKDANPSAVFCYEPSPSAGWSGSADDNKILCRPGANAERLRIPGANGSNFKVYAPGGFYDLCMELFELKVGSTEGSKCGHFKANKITINIVPRSTYTMIYYLGEVVRRSLFPDDFNDNDVKLGVVLFRPRSTANSSQQANCARTIPPGTKTNDSYENYYCSPIFRVVRGDGPGALSVKFDGERFVVPNSAQEPIDRRTDMTYEVLDIVTELVDLNRSAKDIPTSSVFALQGLP